LWNPKSSIVFVGYQAEGTLGRSIVSGDKDVSVFGEKIHVNAEIFNLEGFSGHADRDDLLEWLGGFKKQPHNIFLIHGETESKRSFAAYAKEKLGFDCTVIENISEFQLNGAVLISSEAPIEASAPKIATDSQMLDIKERIAKVHDNLETILYNANLALGSKLSEDQMNQIGNIMLEIEKSAINLGTEVIPSKSIREGTTEAV
jgi:metallo-beta-lactamase family protein